MIRLAILAQPALVPLQERDKPGARIQGARVPSLLDAGHSTKLMALSFSKGFHRHAEVLLGFTRSGQDLHFCFR